MSNQHKILVAYFSAGGVTKDVAKEIADKTNGDLFEIIPKTAYTDKDLDWTDKNSRSSVEMADKSSRPQIAKTCDDIDGYDTVFLGFPIWWYVAPTIVNTFLESHNFDGKHIILFATSGGSGFGKTLDELKPSCGKDVKWTVGKVLRRGGVADWLKTLDI